MDISRLSEKELRELNHKVVERLRFLQQAKAHNAMLKFNIGEFVSFESNDGIVSGIISKFNKKTVTVVTSSGSRWNVSPSFLFKSDFRDVTPNKSKTIKITIDSNQNKQPQLNVSRNALCPCGSGKKYKRCCLK